MRAVNLLPDELRPGARWASVGRGASARHVLGGSGIAAGVLALAFTGLLMHERGVVDDRRSALHDVETRLVAAQAQAAEVQATQAATAARLAAMRTVASQRIVWDDVLRDLSRVMPQAVVLQSLNASSPTLTALTAASAAAPAGVPTGFTVAGATDSQNSVALALDRLALLPWLSNVTLQSSVRDSGSDEFLRAVHDRRSARPDRSPKMIEKLNGRTAVGIAAVGLLLVLLIGWFGVVSPQRSKAAELTLQIEDADTQLAVAQALVNGPQLRLSTAELGDAAHSHSGRGSDVAAPAAAVEGLRRLACADPGHHATARRRDRRRRRRPAEHRDRGALFPDPGLPAPPADSGGHPTTTRCGLRDGSSLSTPSSSRVRARQPEVA